MFRLIVVTALGKPWGKLKDFEVSIVKFATCIVSSRGLFSYQSMAVVINLP